MNRFFWLAFFVAVVFIVFFPFVQVFGAVVDLGVHPASVAVSGDKRSVVFKGASGDFDVLLNGLKFTQSFDYRIVSELAGNSVLLYHLVAPNVLVANWNPSLFKFSVNTKLLSEDQFVRFRVKHRADFFVDVENPDFNRTGKCIGNYQSEGECIFFIPALRNGHYLPQNIQWNFGDVNTIIFDEDVALDSKHLVFKGFVRDFSPDIKAGFEPVEIKINKDIVSLIFSTKKNVSVGDLKIGDFFIDTNFSDGNFFRTEVAVDANLILDIQSGSSYFSRGDYNSPIIDAGSSVTWNDFNFSEVQPYQTELPNNNVSVQDVNTTNMVGLWHFNGDFNDSSGNDNNGTCTTCPISVSDGKFNGAYDYNTTTTSIVNVVDNATLDLNVSFTIAVWVKPFVTNVLNALVVKGNETGGDRPYSLYLNTTRATFYGYLSAGFYTFQTSSSAVTANAWNHVVYTRNADGNTESMYVNGVNKVTGTYTNYVLNSANPLHFGKNVPYPDEDLNGLLDEVALWKRALSQEEVRNLYRRGVLDMNLQVRSCDDVSCVGESFVGPDGTSGTAFPDGNFNWDLNGISANRYFEYKANLATQDVNSLMTMTPQLSRVAIRYTGAAGGWTNTVPVLDINAIDGFADTSAFKVFRYFTDQNLTIDFNAFDFDNNRLFIDLNYSTSNLQGTGTVIVSDLNLTSTYCNDQNFANSNGVECSFDFNIHQSLVADANYYIIGLLNDKAGGTATDFNNTDFNFAVDNITTATITAVAQTNRPLNSVDGNVLVTWTDLPNENNYTLYRSTNGSTFTNIASIAQNISAYVNNPLADNTLFYYILQANGPDTNSNTAQAFTFDRTAPTSGVLTATENFSLDYIDLNWTAASDNNSVAGTIDYNVFRSDTNLSGSFTTKVVSVFNGTLTYADATATDTNGPQTPASPTVTAISTTVLDVNYLSVDDNASRYYFVVQALDEQGNDSNSNSDTNVVRSGVKRFYADCVSGGSCSASNSTSDDYNSNNPLGVRISGLSASTNYCFKVLASDGADNNSALSGQTCASTLNPTISDLSAVPQTNRSLNSSDGNVLLVWTDIAGETGYTVFRSTDGVAYSTVITLATGVDDYNNSGIADNTLFYFKVQANFSSGLDTNSNVATAFTYDRTAPISGILTVTENKPNNYLDLNWTNATDNNATTAEMDYNVFRSDTNLTDSFTTKVVSVFNGTITYADTTAIDANSPNTPSAPTLIVLSTTSIDVNFVNVDDRGSRYYFRVQAQDNQRNDSNSNVDTNVNTTGTERFYVDCVSGGSCAEGGGGVIDDYNFVSGTGVRLTGLAVETQYCFKVKAIDDADNNSVLSGQTCATTFSNAPDVNVNSPNGAQWISQYRNGLDTNTLIDFNASDPNNPSALYADIYISSNQNSFTTLIVNDLNLLYLALSPTVDANCSGQPFGQSRQCFYDFNTVTYADANFFIDINVFDAFDANKVDSSNLSFRIDQNKARTSWDGNNNDWQNFDANVHLTCTDIGGSGCQTTRFRKDTDAGNGITLGAWITYDANVLFNSDGNFAIDFNSSDRANNVGDVNRFYVLVDKTVPIFVSKYPTSDLSSASDSNPLFWLSFSDQNSLPKSCRYHVFVNGTNQAPYNRFTDANQSLPTSFCLANVSLTSDQNAFVHFDVISDGADNNSSIDQNTSYQTFTGSSTLDISVSGIDVTLSQGSDLTYSAIVTNNSASLTNALSVSTTCDQLATVPSSLASIAGNSTGALSLVFHGIYSGNYDCAIRVFRDTAPTGSVGVPVLIRVLSSGQGDGGEPIKPPELAQDVLPFLFTPLVGLNFVWPSFVLVLGSFLAGLFLFVRTKFKKLGYLFIGLALVGFAVLSFLLVPFLQEKVLFVWGWLLGNVLGFIQNYGFERFLFEPFSWLNFVSPILLVGLAFLFFGYVFFVSGWKAIGSGVLIVGVVLLGLGVAY